jgi:hypothetical protein
MSKLGDIMESVERLEKVASGTKTIEVRKAVADCLHKMASIVDNMNLAPEVARMSLKEVESEVDKLYGNQSTNETYYFSRRGILPKDSLGGALDRIKRDAPVPPPGATK